MKTMATELKGNPFAALGVGLASKLTDGMLDTFVSPAGLSAPLEGHRPSGNSKRTSEIKEISFMEFLKNFNYSLDSTSKASFWIKSEEKCKFIMSRQGLSWKLTNVLIPMPE